MKIIFLCGSLEPGRDGVGDYTRRLAGEVIRQGHEASAIALNDAHISQKVSQLQNIDGINLAVLRLPALLPTNAKLNYAKSWIDTFAPDIISLQFVTFAFHPKGLSLSLTRFLAKLGAGRKWHIMFHELWVGMALNDTFKLKVLGKLQKLMILNLIRRLKPSGIHSQTELFVAELNRQHCKARKLPLFSNIDFYGSETMTDTVENHSCGKGRIFKFVFFGGLHPQSKLLELVAKIKEYGTENSDTIEFIYVGRNGNELNNHLEILQREAIRYRVLGELHSKEISVLLSTSSFGISTASPQVIEKSGTVAAMLDHRLPIICIGRDLKLRNQSLLKKPHTIFFVEDLERLLVHPPIIHSTTKLSGIAQMFIKDVTSFLLN